jgi:Tfp pilus assembly protein FimT
MNLRPFSQHPVRQDRRGFTMVELALVFVIMGLMTAMGVPKMRRVIQASQVSRTSALVATDLERAITIASRYRKPMRLSCTVAAGVCSSGAYSVADRTGGTVRLSRNLQADGQLGNMTLTLSQTPVDIFPTGVVSIATPPLTVRITYGSSTRGVTMTTAGQVRIVP